MFIFFVKTEVNICSAARSEVVVFDRLGCQIFFVKNQLIDCHSNELGMLITTGIFPPAFFLWLLSFVCVYRAGRLCGMLDMHTKIWGEILYRRKDIILT